MTPTYVDDFIAWLFGWENDWTGIDLTPDEIAWMESDR